MTTKGFKPAKDGFHPTQIKIEAELEHKRLSKEFKEQILSKLFSSQFFVFLITAAVIASGLIFIQKTTELEKIIEYWKIILPLITTYIGYAIGRARDSE